MSMVIVKRGNFAHVYHTNDEIEVLGHDYGSGQLRYSLNFLSLLTFLVVLADEDTTDVKLDVVPLLLRLKQVERSSFRDEEHGLEFELAFDREMLDGKVILPVVTD